MSFSPMRSPTTPPATPPAGAGAPSASASGAGRLVETGAGETGARAAAWARWGAAPIALSVTEAHPLALLTLVVATLVGGGGLTVISPAPLLALLVALLSNLWLASVALPLRRRGRLAKLVGDGLALLGALLTFALLCAVNPYLFAGGEAAGAPDSALAAIALTLAWALAVTAWIALRAWVFARGMFGRAGASYRLLSLTFRAGVAATLGALVFAALTPGERLLLGMAAVALPVTLASGFVALTLAQRMALGEEQAQAPSRATLYAGWARRVSRSGLLALAALVALEVAVALVAFSGLAPTLTLADLPRRDGSASGGMRGLSQFYRPFTATAQTPPQTPPSQSAPAALATILSLALALALVAGVALAVALWLRRRWRAVAADADAKLAPQTLEAIARAQRQRTAREAGERNMSAVRAAYREVLRAAARRDGAAARRPAETAREYATRLRSLLQVEGAERAEIEATLDELTRAYSGERYGGVAVGDARVERLRQWLPRLIGALPRRARRKPRPPAQRARWAPRGATRMITWMLTRVVAYDE